MLKECNYAILVEGYKTTLWNNGRIENNVRGICFEHNSYGEIPKLEIYK